MSSLSWRLTSPFRKLYGPFARLRTSPFGVKLAAALRHPTNSRKRKAYRARHMPRFPASALPTRPALSRLTANLCALARHPFSRPLRKAYRRRLRRTAESRQQHHMPPSYRPVAPSLALLEKISSERGAETRKPTVDVIVPVYLGRPDTLACIASVLLSKNDTAFELIVIDDHSPEVELSRDLHLLSTRGLFTYLRNDTNLGFVKTVNRGMRLHPDRDVLLLNSDTLVFNNWLDRIRAHALEEKVATVTPFTNNGTICSYPIFCSNNSAQLEIPYDTVDRLAASINFGLSVEVPTGVGFCMYIRRSALDDVGLFDEDTFGKGYGEENDFCMRAQARGWRNLHALDTFVFHSGETSFSSASTSSKNQAYKALLKKHPDYEKIVHSFIANDPARLGRMNIDISCLLRRPPKSTILCFSHGWGGGIDRYLSDRAEQLQSKGIDLLIATPADPGSLKARIAVHNGAMQSGRVTLVTAPNLARIDLVNDREVLRQFLLSCRTRHIEVHSTAGWSSDLLKALPAFANFCGLEYQVMLHDYIPICPQIHLVDNSELYCGEKGTAQCDDCLRHCRVLPYRVHPNLASIGTINNWRSAYHNFLRSAARVSAPSVDTANRVQRYFSDIQINVRPHKENLSHISQSAAPIQIGDRLRVVVIGAIVTHKGSQVLRSCAFDAARRDLPLDFVVVGYTNDQALLTYPNVSVTGPYRDSDVSGILIAQRAHIAFLPSICPETYSYTLSIAVAAGFPVVAFDIGAPAERLRRSGKDHMLLPLDFARHPDRINDCLIELASGLLLRRHNEYNCAINFNGEDDGSVVDRRLGEGGFPGREIRNQPQQVAHSMRSGAARCQP